jgi:hypothetical protein
VKIRIAGRGGAAYLGRLRPQSTNPSDDLAYADPERRLRRLLRRLPNRMQAIIRWLRKPASGWARMPAGIGLIIGGCLAILPVFGLWMLPLGLMLLADDIPQLRRFRDRGLDWLERRRPNWFAAAGRATGTEAPGR